MWQRRQPLISFFASLSYRRNLSLNLPTYAKLCHECSDRAGEHEAWAARPTPDLNALDQAG